jgi:glutathione S-transferase
VSQLILYQYDECPYCQKVQRAITDLALQDRIELRNTRRNPAFRDELRGLTGRTQVPCLVIDGRPMLESDDIVDYLYHTYGQGKQPKRSIWNPWS